MITSKFTIIVLVLLSVLLILFLVGRKSVRAEVSIAASTDEVWSVLTDATRIKEWNKVLIPVEGQLIEGAKVTYEFFQEEGGDAATMAATVKQMVPSQLINQKGGMFGILTFDHKYLLEATATGSIVRIEEQYRGIMVPFWNPAPVERAYERLLLSLKGRVEALSTNND